MERAGIGLGLGSLIDRVKTPCSRPPATRRPTRPRSRVGSRAARAAASRKDEGGEEKRGGGGKRRRSGTAAPPRPSSFKSYRRARRAGLAAAGDDDARENVRADDVFRALCGQPLRALCVRVSSRFDTFILLTILANAVVLCMMEPTKLEGAGAARRDARRGKRGD